MNERLSRVTVRRSAVAVLVSLMTLMAGGCIATPSIRPASRSFVVSHSRVFYGIRRGDVIERAPSPSGVRRIEKDLSDVARAIAAISHSSGIDDAYTSTTGVQRRAEEIRFSVRLTASGVPLANGEIGIPIDEIRKALTTALPLVENLEDGGEEHFLLAMRKYRIRVMTMLDEEVFDHVTQGQTILETAEGADLEYREILVALVAPHVFRALFPCDSATADCGAVEDAYALLVTVTIFPELSMQSYLESDAFFGNTETAEVRRERLSAILEGPLRSLFDWYMADRQEYEDQ